MAHMHSFFYGDKDSIVRFIQYVGLIFWNPIKFYAWKHEKLAIDEQVGSSSDNGVGHINFIIYIYTLWGYIMRPCIVCVSWACPEIQLSGENLCFIYIYIYMDG